eukprot:UN08135
MIEQKLTSIRSIFPEEFRPTTPEAKQLLFSQGQIPVALSLSNKFNIFHFNTEKLLKHNGYKHVTSFGTYNSLTVDRLESSKDKLGLYRGQPVPFEIRGVC